MRARLWSPSLGVFLSMDELGFHDRTSTLYGWPGQNPLKYSDPSGRNPVVIAIAVAPAFGLAADSGPLAENNSHAYLMSDVALGYLGGKATGLALELLAARVLGPILGPRIQAIFQAVFAAESEAGTESLVRMERTSLARSIRSWIKETAKHRAKLREYSADPLSVDNKGMLTKCENSGRTEQIIESRIRQLEGQRKGMEDNILEAEKRLLELGGPGD
jgi:hypothetical protein